MLYFSHNKERGNSKMKKIIEGIKTFSENHSMTMTIIFSVATLIGFLVLFLVATV